MNAPEIRTLTVTELNTLAKDYLENLPLFRNISVKGELSNVTLHRTGHIYFSIKDEGAAVSAVMWRSDVSSLDFMPENGQKVTAEGRVTLWVQRGQYTFNVRSMRKDGAGDLFAAFEELKRRLAAEGLFDASRKKPLPKYPRTVGIITAPTGAAIRDMINVTGRRFPLAKILLYPTLVQGDGAAPQMIEALRAFNREKKADVIILGRGGGSTEDLWAFNDEALARAVCASEIPVVSAVGHEVDYTICDFAADLRAPTPSAAAELVVPDRAETKRRLQNVITAMRKPLADKIQSERRVLQALRGNRVLTDPLASFDERRLALGALDDKLCLFAETAVTKSRERLHALAGRLESLSPLSVLSRGYAAVFSAGGRVINSVSRVPDEPFEVRFADGGVRVARTDE
ncbi:MAG TPA: exodeoxyribonuclease VII large subunit [Firmicutes bacterium]|nr:exodeoxyribonuclease VII large subunit [Bacillota bacterium]